MITLKLFNLDTNQLVSLNFLTAFPLLTDMSGNRMTFNVIVKLISKN